MKSLRLEPGWIVYDVQSDLAVELEVARSLERLSCWYIT